MSLKGKSLHHYCNQSSNYETVKAILDQAKNNGDRNCKKILEEKLGMEQHTPLHDAVFSQTHNIVEMLLNYGADVNAKTSMSYTPLHLATFNNDLNCLKLLLQHHCIDVSAKDCSKKTAYERAKLDGNEEIAKYIKSEEIKQAAKKNSETLENIVQGLTGNEVTVTCFHDALQLAVAEGHMKATKVLLTVAAKKDDLLKSVKPEFVIRVCVDKGFHDLLTLLMLCLFAKKGLVILIEDLFDHNVSDFAVDVALSSIWDIDDVASYRSCRSIVRTILKGKKCSDLAPAISYAETYRQYEAMNTLLCFNCCGEPSTSPKANWRGLALRSLASSLITEPEFLKKICCIDLRNNSLHSVPVELFQLKSLNTLMLSHNNLQELPPKMEWATPALRTLHLSSNTLSTLPDCFADTKISELYLDRNKFRFIPECVFVMVSLETLNIEENPGITQIPDALGNLRHLRTFKFDVSKILKPTRIRDHNQSTSQLVNWLWNRLHCSIKYATVRLMVTGWQSKGKTTLIHRLEKDFQFNENVATEGIQISELKRRRSFVSLTDPSDLKFQVWDFAGHEDYYVTHLCFMSAVGLYLLVWNLTDGENGVHKLEPWLDTIAARQEPRSIGVQSVPPTVIVVGTHLDEIKKDDIKKHDSKYSERYIHTMRTIIRKMIASKYEDRLNLADVLEVNCAFGSNNEGIKELRDKIFCQGMDLIKIVNEREIRLCEELVPRSFVTLVDRIRCLRSEVKSTLPVLSAQEFRHEVHAVSDNAHMEHPEDFEEALQFLKERGIIVHFDDPNDNLRDLYFIDPLWLCRLMSRVISFSTSSTNFVGPDGILEISKLKRLKSDQRFPPECWQQYIRLLNRLQVVFSLDEKHLLVPSKFPIDKPNCASIGNPIRRLICLGHLPHGFISRLTARIMHFLPALIKETESVESGIVQVPTTFIHDDNLSWTDTLNSEVKQSNTSHPKQETHSTIELELLKNSQLRCWRSGMHFERNNCSFLLELTTFSGQHALEIQICSSEVGRIALCFLVDHVNTLVEDWFSGLRIQHIIPCTKCAKFGFKPYMFTFEKCQEVFTKVEQITCPHHKDLPVAAQDLAPDLLLHDVSTELFLKPHELKYDSDCKYSLLDSGSFGKVYRGHCRDKAAAIKVFSRSLNTPYYSHRELRKEVNVLRRVLHHQHLVTLLGVSLSPPCVALELAEQRSLVDILFGNSYIPRLVLFMIAYEVADAMSFLHGLGIIHRDLKPRNILLYSLEENDPVHVKLTDFGTASFVGPCGLKSQKGPVEICAPEMLEFTDQAEYGPKVDIYSFGILLYNLITRQHAFEKCHTIEIKEKVLSGDRPAWRDVAAATLELVSMTQLMCRCWKQKPFERPTALEIREQLSKPICQLIMSNLALPTTSSFECAVAVAHRHQIWLAVKENANNFILIMSLEDNRLEHVIEIKSEHEHATIQQMHLVENQVLVDFDHGEEDYLTILQFYDTLDYTVHNKSTLKLNVAVLDVASIHQNLLLAHGAHGCQFYKRNYDKDVICAFNPNKPVISVATTPDSLWALSFDTLQIFKLPLVIELDGFPFGPAIPLSKIFDKNFKPASVDVLEDSDTSNSHIDKLSLETNVPDTCGQSSNEGKAHQDDLPTVSGAIQSSQLFTNKDECCGRQFGQAKIKASLDGKFMWVKQNNLLAKFRVEDQTETTMFDIAATESTLYGDISCFEPALDTVWVGTTNGFILILSDKTGAILTAFKPYEQSVLSLSFCHFMSPPVVVSCGVRLNRTVFSSDKFGNPAILLSLDKAKVFRSGSRKRVKSSSKLQVKTARSLNLVESPTETHNVILIWQVTSELNLQKMKS